MQESSFLSVFSSNRCCRQHIRQPQYQQLAAEEHLRTCGDGKFHMFPFFKIIQENKSLRKSYKDYFIDKFKPLLNKTSQKPPKVEGSYYDVISILDT